MEEAQMKATDPNILYSELMDSRVPKTEKEHFAARRISELEDALRDALGENNG